MNKNRNYQNFEHYGSWAGKDGQYLRKKTPKSHQISSNLYYFFQLNSKKNKKIRLTKISQFIDESSSGIAEQLLIKEIEKKIEIEKAKGVKSETEFQEFETNERENLYFEIEPLHADDSIDQEIHPEMDFDRRIIVREILKRKNDYNKINYLNYLRQNIFALLSILTPTPQKKGKDIQNNKLIFKLKTSLNDSDLIDSRFVLDSNQKNEDLIKDLKKKVLESLLKEVKKTITLIQNSSSLQEDFLDTIVLDISQQICENQKEIEFTISKDIQTNESNEFLKGEPQQEKNMFLHPVIQDQIQEIEKEDKDNEPGFYGSTVLKALLSIPYYFTHLQP
jgi:hypothetical protein